MKVLDQGFLFCTVNKANESIVSKTVFLNRRFEAEASLVVDTRHFKIKEANWEVHKANGELPLGKGSAAGLNGAQAYFNIHRELGKLLKPDGGEKLKALFFECLKGLIQAETYVFKERGFCSEAEYEEYWREREKNGCLYYSHADEHGERWFDHVGSHRREGNLFNRCKNYKIIENGLNLISQGTFSDSFHEMNAEICFDKDTGIVRTCELSVFRGPGGICFDNGKHGDRFIGKNMNTMTKREIIDIVGGSQGCYHLVDLIADLLTAVKERDEAAPFSMPGRTEK